MKTVGITGNIGCGKTFICNCFEQLGVHVFYSDAEARDLYYIPEVKQTLTGRFGSGFYQTDGSIDKAFVSNLVFNDREAGAFIEQTLYPALHRRFDKWCEPFGSEPYVLYESAIIFEKHIESRFDAIILITADTETRIRRVMSRDKCTRESVEQRIGNQWDEDRKLMLADYVIEHNEDVLPLEQILAIDSRLRK